MKHDNTINPQQLAYIHGRIERELETFSTSLGVPLTYLTARVAELLHSTAGGPLLGTEHSVSGLRATPSQGSSAPQSLAMAERASSKALVIKPHRMTDDERKLIIKLHKKGVTNVEIVKQVGRSRSAVDKLVTATRRYVARKSVASPAGYWAKMTPKERRDEMSRRYQVRLARKATAAEAATV